MESPELPCTENIALVHATPASLSQSTTLRVFNNRRKAILIILRKSQEIGGGENLAR